MIPFSQNRGVRVMASSAGPGSCRDQELNTIGKTKLNISSISLLKRGGSWSQPWRAFLSLFYFFWTADQGGPTPVKVLGPKGRQRMSHLSRRSHDVIIAVRCFCFRSRRLLHPAMISCHCVGLKVGDQRGFVLFPGAEFSSAVP